MTKSTTRNRIRICRYMLSTLLTLFVLSAEARDLIVVAVGNSISRHMPWPEKGWTGNWGMAASCLHCDYVSKVSRGISDRLQGQDLLTIRINVANLERSPGQFDVSEVSNAVVGKPDVLIIFLGDNIENRSPANLLSFVSKLEAIDRSIGSYAKYKIVVGTWWQKNDVDAVLQGFAERIGGRFVGLDGLFGDKRNVAVSTGLWKDAGVAAHPSDAGMSEIAERILKAIPDNIGEAR